MKNKSIEYRKCSDSDVEDTLAQGMRSPRVSVGFVHLSVRHMTVIRLCLIVLTVLVSCLILAGYLWCDDGVSPYEKSITYSEPYIYTGNNETKIHGQPFPFCTCHDPKPSHFLNLEAETTDMSNFVIVTAASSNHFRESRDMVASVQQMMPGKKIIYYDLGLWSWQINEAKTWCDVEFRTFNLSFWPRHVKYLKYYAWKGILISEVLLEQDSIFWMDASVRLTYHAQNHTNWQTVYAKALTTGGVVQFDPTERDVYQCTTPGMYKYLPGDRERLKRYEMLGSGSVLIYRTPEVYNQIIRWWRLCSLTEECIHPSGHKRNCGSVDVPGVSICHRYDQSALSILVANLLDYQDNLARFDDNNILNIQREVTYLYQLQNTCIRNNTGL